MDFFGYQDKAHRKTGILVFYFLLAAFLIICFVYLAFQASLLFLINKNKGPVDVMHFWNPELFLWVSFFTLILIASGTIFKISQISKGGDSIARLMGGLKISPNTKDRLERRLINVVEEMAIASGCPVPSVFIMPFERGINAFAAGFSTNDAVIAVTRGTLETLTRDELQGVIAHEFSHIFNGDMNLNIKLMGILHGILLIGILGLTLLRILLPGRRYGRSRSSNKSDARVLLAIGMLGGLLFIIGYIGVFFGKLIKSAISREREFLADASAVQFTRNPQGIAGALKKIAGYPNGSKILHSKAEETSHMFFGNGLKSSFWHLLSTHPPLETRIKRIDPDFNGKIEKVAPIKPTMYGEKAVSGFQAGHIKSKSMEQKSNFKVSTSSVMSKIGTIDPDNVNFASNLIKSIPEDLNEIVREPFGARAVIFYILLDDKVEVRKKQMSWLEKNCDEFVLKEIKNIAEIFSKNDPGFRLPIVDLCMPALKELSFPQYEQFTKNVNFLILADNRISLFEYSMQKILLKNLNPVFTEKTKKAARYYSFNAFHKELEIMFSSLASFGNEKTEDAHLAFEKGIQSLKIRNKTFNYFPFKEENFKVLDKALLIFSDMIPPLKKRLMEGCLGCVMADGYVNQKEMELIRAIGEFIEVPVPLVIPEQAFI